MILTNDTISAELIGGVVSGSSQVNADTVTNFDSNVKAKLTAETVVSGSAQVIDFVTAGDLDMSGNKVLFGNVYNTEGDLPTASSYHGMFAHVHGTTKGYYAHGGNWIKLIDESSSDTNDLTEGSSNLYYTDTRVKVKLNAETVVSGSSQITLGGDVTGTADDVNVGSVQGISLTSGEVTQIAAIGSTTISATQWGYLGATNQGLSTSDNVTFADGDFTGDVQVTGNLTVLGAATEISSTELRIEDKLITVASGSADSAASDGAGIEIDGAGVSLQWDHNTTSFVLNAKVSSSVGFKGEGGELTGIDTAQVTEASNLYYTDARVKTKLDAETVVSGSSQINADTITNFDSNVKTKLDAETVVSGSSQINYSSLSGINNNIISSSSDTSQVDMIINGGSISANLKGGVVSGSSQINSDQTTGWVADVRKQIDNVGLISGSVQVNANTITNFDSNVKTKLDVDSVHSGSFLGTASTTNLSEGSNKYYTDARVKTKLDAENVISSSIQVLGGTNIVSGSSQIDHDATTNFVANEHIDHSSITLGSGLGLSGGGTIDTNRSISLDTTSSHFTDGVKTKLNAETVVSGSAQVDYDSISNQPTTITSDQASKIAANHLKVGYTDALVKTKLNSETVVSGSTFSSPSQGTVRATINGVSTNVDTGLQTGDSPTFNTLTLSSVAAGGSTDFDAVFDVSGLLKKRTIGTAAFLNVSASIADDPNSIPTTKAVNDALIEAGAGDITAVNSTSTISPTLTGLVHTQQGTVSGGAYGNVGNVVLAVATGSAHFQAGVELYSSNISNASDIGLGNVTNESKSTMFGSPTFTGVPISTTPADNDNSTKIATTAFVMREVSDLLGGAPAAFDTLLEISSSIANGDSDVVSLTTTVGGKLQKDQNLSDLTNASTARTNLGIAGGSAGTFLKHDGTFGTPSYIANTNTQLSTSEVRGKFTAGTNIAISSGEISSTDTNTQLSTADVRGKISASGNSQYNSSTGVITSTDTNTTYSVGDGGLTTNDFTDDDHNKLNGIEIGANVTDAANVLTSLPDGVVSGSSQVSYNSISNRPTTITSDQASKIAANHLKVGYTDALVKTKLDADEVFSGSLSTSDVTEISNLTAAEGAQLENINSVTISNTQWGYLGASNQDVKTNSNVTFASASLADLTISGNLVVLGDSVEISSTELKIEDKLITVASGSSNSAAANGGGIEVDRGSDANASIVWNHANTRFNISNSTHVTGTIESTSDIIAFSSSDRELKSNILPIPWALEKINKIGGYSFDWNEEKQDIYKGTDIGVIAQEIEEVLPELVQTRENGYKAVKYDKLVSLLIEGIKDLSKEVDELKRKVNNQ